MIADTRIRHCPCIPLDELAFYDALEVNDSTVQVLGDGILKEFAQMLVEQARKNATIDWRSR